MPESLSFNDAQGVAVAYYRWNPEGAPKAIVLIAHGASEHGARYDRFATFLAAHGYAVFAQDHRGHGHTGTATGAGIIGPGGWQALVDDQHELVTLARAAVQNVPAVLFAHSMGSFLAQRYIQQYGNEIDGVVLSGSAGGLDNVEGTIELIDMVAADAGMDSPAPSFPGLNDAFAPARTDFDWLSRDEAEVDKYIADPFCGDNNPLSLGFARGMLATALEAWKPENEAAIPKDLPVLFITGENDPVSQSAATVRALEQRYRDLGIKDVTARYYPDARHELLNEINRDDVQNDVVAWIDRVVS
ncbi:MAG: hypothetical protein QOJ00_1673 [Actinomycetota bacterium]|jgi:alpha-beta hydrolase superfamily lysophospholipase